MKFKIKAPVDYISGYIHDGHYEGVVDISEEDIEKFANNPIEYIYNYDYLDDLEFVIDDIRVNDIGKIADITYVKV